MARGFSRMRRMTADLLFALIRCIRVIRVLFEFQINAECLNCLFIFLSSLRIIFAMASPDLQKASTPIRHRKLTIRSRFVKTATNEGMWTDCLPNQQLVDHHARLAKGGIGLTTIAHGAVNPDGRTNEWQMHFLES
jgi:hypothetical protein